MSEQIHTMPLKLQMGLYPTLPGFIHVTPHYDELPDYKLPFPDDSISELYCRGVLEFVKPERAAACLKDWLRVLEPRGRMDLRLPDMPQLFDQILKEEDDNKRIVLVNGRLFGRTLMVRMLYWECMLDRLLNGSGFHRVERLPTGDLHMIAFKRDDETKKEEEKGQDQKAAQS